MRVGIWQKWHCIWWSSKSPRIAGIHCRIHVWEDRTPHWPKGLVVTTRSSLPRTLGASLYENGQKAFSFYRCFAPWPRWSPPSEFRSRPVIGWRSTHHVVPLKHRSVARGVLLGIFDRYKTTVYNHQTSTKWSDYSSLCVLVLYSYFIPGVVSNICHVIVSVMWFAYFIMSGDSPPSCGQLSSGGWALYRGKTPSSSQGHTAIARLSKPHVKANNLVTSLAQQLTGIGETRCVSVSAYQAILPFCN